MAVGRIDIILGAKSEALINGLTRGQAAADLAAKKFEDVSVRISNATRIAGEGAQRVGQFATSLAGRLSDIANVYGDLTIAAGASVSQFAAVAEGIGGIAESASTASSVFNVFTQLTLAGATKMAGTFPRIGSAITALAGPIGLIGGGIIALGLIVYSNFENISKAARVVTNSFIRLYNQSLPLRIAAETIYNAFNIAFTLIKTGAQSAILLLSGIGNVLGALAARDVQKFKEAISDVGDIPIKISLLNANAAEKIKDDFNASLARIRGDVKLNEFSEEEWESKVAGPVRKFLRISKPTLEPELDDKKLKTGFEKAKETIQQELTDAQKLFIGALYFPDLVFKGKIEVPELASINTQGIVQGLTDVDRVFIKLNENIKQNQNNFKFAGDEMGRLNAQSKILEQAMVDLGSTGIEENDLRLQLLIQKFNATQEAMAELEVTAEEKGKSITEKMLAFSDAISGFITTAVTDTATQLGVALGNALSGVQSFNEAALSVVSVAMQAFGGLMVSIGKTAIAQGLVIEKIRAGLVTLQGIPAIAAGIALVAVGTAFKNLVPKAGGGGGVALANGGIASGETLALVGDNKNAKFNPEVISPLSNLEDILVRSLERRGVGGGGGSLNLNITGSLGHRQMALAVQNGNRLLNRVR